MATHRISKQHKDRWNLVYSAQTNQKTQYKDGFPKSLWYCCINKTAKPFSMNLSLAYWRVCCGVCAPLSSEWEDKVTNLSRSEEQSPPHTHACTHTHGHTHMDTHGWILHQRILKQLSACKHFLPSLNNTQGEVIKLLVIYRKMIAKHNSLEVMLNRWCHL